MPSSKKLIGAAALTAALAGGGVVGALFGTPTLSSAQTSTTEAPAEVEAGAGEEATPEDGHHCERHGVRGAGLEAAAEALGMSEDDLRTALRDGQTIAQVAEAQGVDVQTVIDAMVADATARIDEAVGDGNLDADRAEELKAELPERIADHVNNGRPEGGPGGPGGRGGRGFRHGPPPADDAGTVGEPAVFFS